MGKGEEVPTSQTGCEKPGTMEEPKEIKKGKKGKCLGCVIMIPSLTNKTG